MKTKKPSKTVEQIAWTFRCPDNAQAKLDAKAKKGGAR